MSRVTQVISGRPGHAGSRVCAFKPWIILPLKSITSEACIFHTFSSAACHSPASTKQVLYPHTYSQGMYLVQSVQARKQNPKLRVCASFPSPSTNQHSFLSSTLWLLPWMLSIITCISVRLELASGIQNIIYLFPRCQRVQCYPRAWKDYWITKRFNARKAWLTLGYLTLNI